MKRILLFTAFLLAFFLLMQLSNSVQASPVPQLPQFATPTPGSDGRILYTVQPGDTCIRISLLAGVPLDQLRALNHLDENCLLQEGQQLLLGIGGPSAVSPTPGPSPTPTPILPTSTPFSGSAEVCVLLYDDKNGDALRQETEPAIADGAVSVTGADTAYSKTQNTVINSDPAAYPGICFADVPEGEYNVSVAIPDGYNATTSLANTLKVNAGDRTFVAFGAQSRGDGPANGGGGGGGGGDNRSVLLGVVGVLLLLGGVGLAVFASRSMGSKPRGYGR
jgi:hypothetical protein